MNFETVGSTLTVLEEWLSQQMERVADSVEDDIQLRVDLISVLSVTQAGIFMAQAGLARCKKIISEEEFWEAFGDSAREANPDEKAPE